MLLYPKEVIEAFYKRLEETGITEELKVITGNSKDAPEYSFMKIYNQNATKENMIQYLKEKLGIEKTITFGSVAGRYEVLIEPGNSEKTVHMLKKMYGPVKIYKKDNLG